MNALIAWFDSPRWFAVLEVLAHTLWAGALSAATAALCLRWVRRAQGRYVVCLVALLTIPIAGVLAWSWPKAPATTETQTSSAIGPSDAGGRGSTAPNQVGVEPPVQPGVHLPPSGGADAWQTTNTWWRPWLAGAWLVGALLMLLRSGLSVRAAVNCGRQSERLEDERVLVLIEAARVSLRLSRRFAVAVSQTLSTPAVVGWWLPTLVLPTSMLTGLAPEQLRLIILHELAHIQRGDYFVNLAQLWIESLLFFNPAVWWLSRQVRLEREVCCDEAAAAVGGAASYARALVSAAEVTRLPVAALGFAGEAEPSSLRQRVERLLRPGERPRLLLSWRAFLGGMVGLSMLAATFSVGTKAAVRAILTPEQRIERIRQVLVEHGETPSTESTKEGADTPALKLLGQVVRADGAALPAELQISTIVSERNSTSISSVALKSDGTFELSVPRGRLQVAVVAPGFAPIVAGPFPSVSTNGAVTNAVPFLRLSLDAGVPMPVRVIDADTQAPVARAQLAVRYWVPGTGTSPFQRQEITTDAAGLARVDHGAPLPFVVSVNTEGYETTELQFEHPSRDGSVTLALRRGGVVAGRVLDQATGKPMPGVAISILYQEGPVTRSYGWEEASARIAVTDAQGSFSTTRLRKDSAYWIGATIPGRASHVWGRVMAGQTNLLAQVGPELVVRGRIRGDISKLPIKEGQFDVGVRTEDPGPPERRSSHAYSVPATVREGEGVFAFTNRYASKVSLFVNGMEREMLVDKPMDNLELDFTPAASGTKAPKPLREMRMRFHPPEGMTAQGDVSVTLPYESAQGVSYAPKIFAIEKGEVRVFVPAGSWCEVQPAKTMAGLWFESRSEPRIPEGTGPLVWDIPMIPAGVIAATARGADGELLSDLSFNIEVLKASPWLKSGTAGVIPLGDSWSSHGGPRRFVSSPLPLGGTYQVVGWKGNAFAASKPFVLEADRPDHRIELRFPALERLTGRVVDSQGRPMAGLRITPGASIKDHGFELASLMTDADGRFSLEGVTPTEANYTLTMKPQADWIVKTVHVDFRSQPITVVLDPGQRLAGTVIEDGSGRAVAGVTVRAVGKGVDWPTQTTVADDSGRFLFTTLGQHEYHLFVDGAQLAGDMVKRAPSKEGKPVVLRVRARADAAK